MIVLTCCAPYGVGGLGRTLVDVERAALESGRDLRIIAGGGGPHTSAGTGLTTVTPGWPALVSKIPPVRFDVGWQQSIEFEAFDRAAARLLETRADAVIAFAGQALHTFFRARSLGYKTLELVSPTAHLNLVWRQHRLAEGRYPLEKDWLNRAHRDRALAEYAMADIIHVPSLYSWDSFVAEGIDASKLRRLNLSPATRFTQSTRAAQQVALRFQAVYTGILSVVKGTPLLLDAFARLDDPDARLVLVGATGSRGMRRFVGERCRADRRVTIAPGDPLPHLATASVYVHPSYQDGFGYAVSEALACGVPVVVSEDTGAKELITPGRNGEIVPTDDVSAVADAIARQHLVWRRTAAQTANRT